MNLKISSFFIVSLIAAFLLASCTYFEKDEARKVIVRVNDSYLYEEDINALINENTSTEDSSLIVSNYITRWATQQLLIDRAQLNLPESQQKEFRDLIENYKNELYTSAYKDAVVGRQLDSSLTKNEKKVYFEENKGNFKLTEDLLKLRYVSLEENNTNIEEIKTYLKRFNEEDKEELEKLSLQFKNYSLNDSVWVKIKTVYDKIPALSSNNRDNLLNKSNFFQVEDSLGVYLIYVNDVLEHGQDAPFEYAEPTIEKILLNRRKRNLIKELEKDITKDAIKNEQFEIYN
ncbi:peptidyl-prolyl cis-trans isomerase [Salegentibacter sp. BDJ18]|uniref:peptidyl-prolyl cis-trans isomerase n=1 Tax=Salegentibacter sp. BDJ18 TaxID=2816376 RepID=UPI001AAF1619|nr:peptidyl-prolyl cis-trans isomerase [Salegentibacter sp. BDJ18]MBO2545946.1 peptidyl-prolyl cis-trans isomerase [Salegentibacter sp. BDJ18]